MGKKHFSLSTTESNSTGNDWPNLDHVPILLPRIVRSLALGELCRVRTEKLSEDTEESHSCLHRQKQ